MLKARTIVMTLCSLGIATAAHAQSPIGWQVSAQSVQPPVGATGERWGASIAFNEDASLLAVGAPDARAQGASGVGKVYIYEVNAPGSEPPWRWSDPHRRLLRIHTKQIGIE